MKRLHSWLNPVIYLSNNWISLLGVIIVTTGAITWLLFLPITFRAGVTDPYFGIVVYLFLPAFFVLGLMLIPIGIWLTRRRRRAQGRLPAEFPPLDLRNRQLRKLGAFILATTFLNVIIASQFAYSAVNYMDSVRFCGQTCHTVMKPQFTAYLHSPHARVECVQCHIGPGESWFVRSKLSGVGQVFAVLLNDYPRPIPVPVRNLRPARETCETCHWPQMAEGDRLLDRVSYTDDEHSTVQHTVLLLYLGGGTNRFGIHGVHVGPGTIRYYASDEQRQTIPWVEHSVQGKTTVYRTADFKGTPDPGRIRVMDCIDCHNRPTHIFMLPDKALDKALANGSISASLPFIKKQGVTILKQPYATSEEAARRIPSAVENYYRTHYPDIYLNRRDEVSRSAQGLLAVFQQNVFPEMKVTWGTYANNLGHMDFPGCFRCHDSSHNASNGNSIPQDCGVCHNLIAMNEQNPKILKELGIETAAPTSSLSTESHTAHKYE